MGYILLSRSRRVITGVRTWSFHEGIVDGLQKGFSRESFEWQLVFTYVVGHKVRTDHLLHTFDKFFPVLLWCA